MNALTAFSIARENGVSPAGLHVLLVCIEDAPTRPVDIAERTGSSPSAITGALDRLEQAGWITRLNHTRDRRSFFVTPTERAFETFTPCCT